MRSFWSINKLIIIVIFILICLLHFGSSMEFEDQYYQNDIEKNN